MDNLRHWNRFADIDPKFTKPITGKAYKGTSPNPQYVIRCLTEIFGPVGEGFGWEVVREDFTPLGDEVLHWCRIKFWHGSRENSFDSYGQTKALMKTKSGLMSDEDAPKKSLTDAIIKAASHIGIAANIFLGRWDDQKHVAQVEREYRDAERVADAPPAPTADDAAAALMKAPTLADLQAQFAALYRNHRAVADHPEVIAAKDVRKTQLTEHKDAA
ncbi:hypothetical protein [Falsirhodobacter sp. 1013]|uniref:hypothetical protein n=1 Tax=Falsirhodobacter sp. 1013 TaxID=3417566 RepID=UPI003EB7D3E0